MSANLFRVRWLLIAGACVLLGFPSIVFAQADPLANCQTRELSFLGPHGIDPWTRTESISVKVHLVCDGIEVFASHVEWNDKIVTATGDVLVIQLETTPTGAHEGGLRLTADRMEMDRETHLATFYNAYGTARITNQPGDKALLLGGQEPDLMFHAAKLERLGPKKYRLTNGAFTTCLQPNPRWQMIGGSGMVELDDHATMKNVRFMVKSLPVLYVPYLYYPLTKDDRSTGLLTPSYSVSGVKGQGISTAYFLVLGRSQDATLYYDYYTKAGQIGAAEYRFASAPGAGGRAFFQTFHEKEQLGADGTIERAANTSYNFDGSVTQSLSRGFRLVGNSIYFTNITTQQRYQQDVQAATNQTRNISIEVSGPLRLGSGPRPRTLQLSGLYIRREIFSGTESSLYGNAPRVSASLRDTLRKSAAACGGAHPSFLCRIYYNLSAEGAFLQSRPFDPTIPVTNVRRFDTRSQVSAPLSGLSFLTVTTAATWRLTEYLDTTDPLTALPVPVPLLRSIFDLGADMSGPVLERVFLTPGSHIAEGFKHVIEPHVQIDWLSPFGEADRIIKIDQNVDQLAAGTTSVAYSITNRLIMKPHGPDGATHNREILTVAIGQKYYTNAQAAAVDPVNPIASVSTLTPVQVSIVANPTYRVSGRFNLLKNSSQWPTHGTPQASTQYSASSVVNLPRLQLIAGWSKTNYYTSAQGFVDIAPVNALYGSTTVSPLRGRMTATYGFNYDVVHQKFLQQRMIVSYRAQCCGIAFDYQAYSTVASTIPVDHRYAITFTLAGIGSFSPPLGGFAR